MRAAIRCVLVFLTGVLLLGANEFQCEPVPVETGPTMRTDADHYVPGEAVVVTIDPGSTAMEVYGQYGFPVYHVEFFGEVGAWLPVDTERPMGCYPTACEDGMPLVLCVDPGPPFCQEHAEPFEWEWSGQVWIEEEQLCGDEVIAIPRSIPATQGSYRIWLAYGEDPSPGDEPDAYSCAPQDLELFSNTFDIYWLPD